jgi:hypothetical protein
MINTFLFTQNQFDMCLSFANNSVNSSIDFYKKRNQFNKPKIIQDILSGKLAEELVYQKLKEYYSDLTEPDYAIYDKKNKSWEADLRVPSENLRIAVKSQTEDAARRWGRSWVFQLGNARDYDKEVVLKKNNHYVALVSLDLPNMCGEIKAIVSIQWLHDNDMFKEMKLKYLQNNKKAVYYDDLISLGEDLFQLEKIK